MRGSKGQLNGALKRCQFNDSSAQLLWFFKVIINLQVQSRAVHLNDGNEFLFAMVLINQGAMNVKTV